MCISQLEKRRYPEKLEDIAEAFDMVSEVEVKELKRTIRLVARNLGTHHITGPEEYFERFHSELGLPRQYLVMQGNFGPK